MVSTFSEAYPKSPIPVSAPIKLTDEEQLLSFHPPGHSIGKLTGRIRHIRHAYRDSMDEYQVIPTHDNCVPARSNRHRLGIPAYDTSIIG